LVPPGDNARDIERLREDECSCHLVQHVSEAREHNRGNEAAHSVKLNLTADVGWDADRECLPRAKIVTKLHFFVGLRDSNNQKEEKSS
jgi:hypothetical protein